MKCVNRMKEGTRPTLLEKVNDCMEQTRSVVALTALYLCSA